MVTLKIGSVNETVDRVPNVCPVCHHAIDARYLTAVYPADGGKRIDAIFQCPLRTCLRAFIGRYGGERDSRVAGFLYKLRSVVPSDPQPPQHADAVPELSPGFASVYAEASRAETWGLGEIAGCGYRKALEFLVKDYCIAQEPEKASVIRSKLLGSVIAEHISDENIKQCARRATWLGNDETHYERRWTSQDISDLKNLIRLTETWVSTHLLTKKYLAAMPDPKAQ